MTITLSMCVIGIGQAKATGTLTGTTDNGTTTMLY